MDLTVNLAPSYRDLKDPTTRQNFDDTVEQKRVIDLRACHVSILMRATEAPGRAMYMCNFQKVNMFGFQLFNMLNLILT